MGNKILLSPEWLAELHDELRFLKEERRVEVAEKLKEAISYGDLSENAEYQEARDLQAQVELRISELEEMLKPWNYEIIEQDDTKKGAHVRVGHTVSVSFLEDGIKQTIAYSIVWSQEADIFENKISNESPLGRALIGKKWGEVVKVTSPAGILEYTIIKIE